MPRVRISTTLKAVSVGVLVERLGRLGIERMAEVCAALAAGTGCAQVPQKVW